MGKDGVVTVEGSWDSPIAQQISHNFQALSKIEGVQFPKPSYPIVISVANQKGGVGKTTSTVNLAAGLALGGWNVVVIDCDPQGNASGALGVPPSSTPVGTYDVLLGDLPLAKVLQPCPDLEGVLVCPATPDLTGAEVEFVNVVGREGLLLQAIERFTEMNTGVDAIILDCPPSLGMLTLNAFVASDGVLIPIQTEYYALVGLSMLVDTINRIRESLKPNLQVFGILLTMVDRRTKLANDVVDEVREHFGDIALQVEIPRSVRVSEAPSYGQTAITYDPRGSGAIAYRMAAQELAQRLTRIM